MKIAISGKGGVGKTTIMAMLADYLNKQGRDVLVIERCWSSAPANMRAHLSII